MENSRRPLLTANNVRSLPFLPCDILFGTGFPLFLSAYVSLGPPRLEDQAKEESLFLGIFRAEDEET